MLPPWSWRSCLPGIGFRQVHTQEQVVSKTPGPGAGEPTPDTCCPEAAGGAAPHPPGPSPAVITPLQGGAWPLKQSAPGPRRPTLTVDARIFLGALGSVSGWSSAYSPRKGLRRGEQGFTGSRGGHGVPRPPGTVRPGEGSPPPPPSTSPWRRSAEGRLHPPLELGGGAAARAQV